MPIPGYRVTLRVKEVTDSGDPSYPPCPRYKVGDKIVFEEPMIIKDKSDQLCLYALSAVTPYLIASCRKTDERDWINNPPHLLQCSDQRRPVIFEIVREPIFKQTV